MRKIVTIGGGSGHYVLLSGLADVEEFALTAVVSMTDSGGSTGRLRDEFGMLPPGDILKCMVALSRQRPAAEALLLKRFSGEERLAGHNAGNLLLAMLSRYTGDFAAGIGALSRLLEVRGTILPVTVDSATLVAELADGSRVFGESAIDVPRTASRSPIREVFLVPHHGDGVAAFPPVISALHEADAILVGPGDLYTSIIANLVVPGLAKAFRESKAPVYYMLNLMTKYGETHGFRGDDFVKTVEAYLGRRVDGILYNRKPPAETALARYRQARSEYVDASAIDTWRETRHAWGGDLLAAGGDTIRHDSRKLAALVKRVVLG